MKLISFNPQRMVIIDEDSQEWHLKFDTELFWKSVYYNYENALVNIYSQTTSIIFIKKRFHIIKINNSMFVPISESYSHPYWSKR
jgi:hypothetical protein